MRNQQKKSELEFSTVKEELEKKRIKEEERRRARQRQENMERAKRAEESAKIRREMEKIRAAKLEEIYKPLPPSEEEEEPKPVENPKRQVEKKAPSYVPSLWNMCIANICENIMLYEGFEHVPVSWKARMFQYLSRKKQLTDEKFENILDPMQKILDLSVCRTSITIDFFRAFKKCPFLTSLSITNSTKVYFTFIPILGTHCKNLERLNLSGCKNISLLKGIYGCEKLKELHIAGLSGMIKDSESVSDLCRLNNLEVLNINDNHWFSVKLLLNILRSLNNLTHFYAENSLSYWNEISDEPRKSIGLTNLRTLRLVNKRGSHYSKESAAEHIFFDEEGNINYPHLEELSVSSLPLLSLEKIISSLPKLTSLTFKVDSIPKGFIERIVPSSVTKLNIFMESLSENEINIAHEDIEYISKSSTQFKEITISEAKKEVLENFIRFFRNPNFDLERINFSEFGNLSDIFQSNIGVLDMQPFIAPMDINWDALKLNKYKNLTSICFGEISWMDIKMFKTFISPKVCPNLEHLNMIGFTKVYHDCAIMQYLLSNFPKLNSLVVGSSSEILNNSFLSNLEGGENIKNLEIWAFKPVCDTQESWTDVLSSFPSLKELMIIGNSRRELPVVGLVDALMAKRSLKTVHLQNVYISPEKKLQLIRNPKCTLDLLFISCSTRVPEEDSLATCQVIYTPSNAYYKPYQNIIPFPIISLKV